MKVLIRADAGLNQGTGHVMRCLTLAEALISRGHQVMLMGDVSSVRWLRKKVMSTGIPLVHCPADELDIRTIAAMEFDWVVIDSYQILAERISDLNDILPCLVIIDGDSRNINATLFVDHNLGAEDRDWPLDVRERLLAGSRYCLVRDEVLRYRKVHQDTKPPLAVAAFMGGTDPLGAILEVTRSLASSRHEFELTVITSESLKERVGAIASTLPNARVFGPTDELPRLIANADVVVSASGTSAWDVCTMGLPAVLVALVDNQVDSLERAVSHGVALGVNAVGRAGNLRSIGKMVDRLASEPDLRRQLTERCLTIFDGRGKARVVEAMELSLQQ